MDVFKKRLVSFIQGIIKDKKNIGIPYHESEKLIKNPPDSSFGDYSLASYYLAGYGFKGKPEEIAEEVFNISEQNFAKIEDFFDKIEIKGAYVNFFVDKEKFSSFTIKSVIEAESGYGRGYPEKPMKVVIDFSSPNIAKPFGVGHLRSTVIGMSLSNIYEFCGHNVIKINYLGDFGTQFGKVITAFCRYDDIDFAEFEKNPVKVLYNLYVRIHKEAEEDGSIENDARDRFKKLEESLVKHNAGGIEDFLKHLVLVKVFLGRKDGIAAYENELLNMGEPGADGRPPKINIENKSSFCKGGEGPYLLWKIIRNLSIEEFKRIYELMGIKFDDYEGESESARFSGEIVKILLESGLAVESEGAIVIPLKDIKNPALIAKSDGTSLYLSRDIITAILRMAKFDYDKTIYVVGSEQSLHFNQLFSIFALLKENINKFDKYPVLQSYISKISGRLTHVKFGRIIGMSTRKGNLVFLEDYIGEAKAKAREKLEERLKNLEDSMYGEILEGSRTLTESEQEQADSASLKVGLGAVIFNDLKTRRATDVNFNWDNVLSFEGQTGPYLQYTVSRINSLASKLNAGSPARETCSRMLNEKTLPGYARNEEDFNDIFLIAKQISHFADAVNEAMEQNEPSVLSSYALELASLFNKYYQNYRLIGKDPGYIKPRLFMLSAVRTLLTRILNLLCIPVLERM